MENLKPLRDWGEDFAIRHPVMPNHVECCTQPVLDWIAEEMPDIPVNIMDQYHPDNFCDPTGGKYDLAPRRPGETADLSRNSRGLPICAEEGTPVRGDHVRTPKKLGTAP